MRFVTTLFNDGDRKYEALTNVLVKSAKLYSPEIHLEVNRIAADDRDLKRTGYGRQKSYTQNTRKTRHHCHVVNSAQDGELLCLMDSDTMFLRECCDVEHLMEGYDFGYTKRKSGFYINSGVVFVRVSLLTRQMYCDWNNNAVLMLSNRDLHFQYKAKYGGINQCALMHTLKAYPQLKVLELPCEEWNSTKETWPTALEKAKIVHVLGDLRRSVTSKRFAVPAYLMPLVDKWKSIEAHVPEKGLGLNPSRI